jgi:hypothetical protein
MSMITRSVLLLALGWIAVTPASAEDHFDPDYQGSEVVASSNGQVHVKAVLFPTDSCWQITGAREGVPDVEADQPTARHLYVTVNVTHGTGDCQPTATPLETRLDIPDKTGKISLDIFFVDERGVLIRSQRHRIQRDGCEC